MPTQFTDNEKIAGFQTQSHIIHVCEFMNIIIGRLLNRSVSHDKSKLQSPQIQIFTEYTHKLSSLTFNSHQYNECKKCMDVALQHHYATNRHHPEHFKNGIDDMNLVDLIQMFIDWKAASIRQHDGNLHKSIQINTDRFNVSKQLKNIFINSIDLLE